MNAPSYPADVSIAADAKPKLNFKNSKATTLVFFTVLVLGLIYSAYSLFHDVDQAGTVVTTWTPFLLLGVALLIALGFEFVNGLHDTANAVATVIYTHSLPPQFAVVWSGCFNFLGVLVSSGAVAFGIIALLPVELILQVGSSAGFAMVFALLIAAIIWNLGTWALGLPASSSHTLIGSIIGVGIANALMHGRDGTSGVDWVQATKVGWKRIVVTVGEKIGKSHLTYAQGASAELVAMVTIGAADMYGLPVSTTHVLSSGVAGTMAANGSGLQMRTIRNLLMAWVLTLPIAILLSGSLYWLFTQLF
ncbi:inorganic phosphate transporter [Pseudomonas sp. GV071]|uniref:inorganic phosphate transporter n=1 Tax=Pseudomonas sp. GV071 TaxID=2135754 RepID=UPI000D339516|nr:inorganic phosphate transporter [Pseudomonas sp. GV071]PTQ67393.1 phosphate transporter family protein [Pseudomonas sp. GV071]